MRAMWLGSHTVYWKFQLPFDTKDDADASVKTHTTEKEL